MTHTPDCSDAFSAWAEAWDKSPVPHIVLKEKWRKQASKCGCLNKSILTELEAK